jgi:hypothetical protein
MLVLLRVAGLPATSTTPSPAFLISMILIIVAQAYRWLCSGWVLPAVWTRVSSQWPNGPPPNNFGYDHTWRAPGTRVSGEEYREFTGQPLTLPVDERAPLAGVVSAHCSTSPRGRHRRRLVSHNCGRTGRAPGARATRPARCYGRHPTLRRSPRPESPSGATAGTCSGCFRKLTDPSGSAVRRPAASDSLSAESPIDAALLDRVEPLLRGLCQVGSAYLVEDRYAGKPDRPMSGSVS